MESKPKVVLTSLVKDRESEGVTAITMYGYVEDEEGIRLSDLALKMVEDSLVIQDVVGKVAKALGCPTLLVNG